MARESTAPITPATHLITRALRFIADNACSGIRARDVIAHLGVSSARVHWRFRKYGQTSLAGEINRIRLEAVKRHLRETRLPIAIITERCGLPSPQYAKRLFKQTFGQKATATPARGLVRPRAGTRPTAPRRRRRST
mgnify:CR=1 FL=1